jgi:hypothetical protein
VCLGYVAAVIVLVRKSVPRALLWTCAGIALFSATLLVVPGLLSSDLVMYAVYGRLAAVYDLNPYLTAPSSMGPDPLLAWAARSPAYAGFATPYGPLWTLLSSAIAALAGSSGPLVQTFAYRVLGLCAHVANACLVWRLAPHVGLRADRHLAVMLYAWNPLVLFELVANGHNDGVMLGLTLLGLLLAFTRSNRLFGIGTVWLGALVKWMSAVPTLYLSAGWVRSPLRASRLAAACAVVLLATAVSFAPWLRLEDVPSLGENFSAGGTRYVNAPLDLPTSWLSAHLIDRAGTDASASQAVVRTWTFGLARVAVAVYVLWELRRLTDEPRRMLEATVRTLLAALLLAATQMLAWYFVWPLALAAPLGAGNRLAQLAVAYTVLYLPIFYALHEDLLSTFVVAPVLLSFAVLPPLAAYLVGRGVPGPLLPSRSSEVAA